MKFENKEPKIHYNARSQYGDEREMYINPSLLKDHCLTPAPKRSVEQTDAVLSRNITTFDNRKGVHAQKSLVPGTARSRIHGRFMLLQSHVHPDLTTSRGGIAGHMA